MFEASGLIIPYGLGPKDSVPGQWTEFKESLGRRQNVQGGNHLGRDRGDYEAGSHMATTMCAWTLGALILVLNCWTPSARLQDKTLEQPCHILEPQKNDGHQRKRV